MEFFTKIQESYPDIYSYLIHETKQSSYQSYMDLLWVDAEHDKVKWTRWVEVSDYIDKNIDQIRLIYIL